MALSRVFASCINTLCPRADAMPKISDEVWEARRQQILAAAWRCFAKNGIQASTIEQIIAESKMSTSAMYRYFKGKDDIVLAAISTNLREFSSIALPAIAAGGDKHPTAFLRDSLHLLDKYAQRDGFNLKAIIVQGWGESFTNEQLSELLKQMYGTYLTGLKGLAVEWKAKGILAANARPVNVASFLMSSFLGAIIQSCVLGTSPSQLAGGLENLMKG